VKSSVDNKAPVKGRLTFQEVANLDRTVDPIPLPQSYTRVTNNPAFDQFMKLSYNHNEDEIARRTEELESLKSMHGFGVPGFVPPVRARTSEPIKPPRRAAKKRPEVFNIGDQDPPTDVEPGQNSLPMPKGKPEALFPGQSSAPLPKGMLEMVQQVKEDADRTKAAKEDAANMQLQIMTDRARQDGQGVEKAAAQLIATGGVPTSDTLRVLSDALERESRERSHMTWQTQGLAPALSYLQHLGPNYGNGNSPENAQNIGSAVTDEVMRRIVEFLRRSSTASARETGEFVDARVRASMFNVLQS